MRYLGKYTAEYLDSVKCFLSFNGADQLGACSAGLAEWKDAFACSTMSAKKVVHRFATYDVGAFIGFGFLDGFPGITHVGERLKIYELDDKSPHLVRYLKALIITAVEDRAKGR